jgi:hypothetical protein
MIPNSNFVERSILNSMLNPPAALYIRASGTSKLFLLDVTVRGLQRGLEPILALRRKIKRAGGDAGATKTGRRLFGGLLCLFAQSESLLLKEARGVLHNTRE